MAGYIKIPRDLFASAEWLTPRIFGKVDAQLDLLQLASWVDGRSVEFRSSTVMLKKGQLVTSIRALAERWSWSTASVHRFLSSLRERKQGCIRVQIETAPEAGKTLITIVDYDRWECQTDVTPFGTHSETLSVTPNVTPMNSENDCNCVDYEGDETESVTRFETQHETADETPNVTRYNKVYNTRDKENINTHTVDTDKGGCRGKIEIPTYSQDQIEDAFDLMQWIANEQPTLYQHYSPSIHPRVICDLLAQYDRSDIEYIIRSIAKKAYYKQTTFAHAFDTFARNDFSVKSLKQQRAEAQPTERRYTYDEMCDEATRRGITTAAFSPVYAGGQKPAYWVRKTIS